MKLAAALGAVALVTAGCSGGDPPADEPVVVFAAASLTDAFEELAVAYESATGRGIALSFDASSALRAQIVEGAPAGVFASADEANAVALVDAGLTRGGTRAFAANGLAIVVPADGGGAVAGWRDLAADGLRIVAAGEDVPISRYAAELVANLAARADAPAGFADAYAANVVSREDNVRAVLTKVELGEGDAGIVYATDAASTDAVRVVEVPDGASVAAGYALVVIADAPPAAADFADWLLGPEAQAILAEHGFRPPR